MQIWPAAPGGWEKFTGDLGADVSQAICTKTSQSYCCIIMLGSNGNKKERRSRKLASAIKDATHFI